MVGGVNSTAVKISAVAKTIFRVLNKLNKIGAIKYENE